MTMERIAQTIPASLRNEATEKLIDIVLNSPNASKMPSALAKTILHHWQKDQLAAEAGLQQLLEASMLLEPEKTISFIEELGLSEIVAMLKETLRK